ncbi:MAG: macro domain-containing protein [Bacteroidota bacterium]
MTFNFIDLNVALCNAWEKVFADVEHVIVKNESIFETPCDALVSPANSYGYMNGGIDFAISKRLGWHVEKRLQHRIREAHFGELLVGQAEVVPTDHAEFPYLISAPTMRHPMTIVRTPNVYLAMRAILILVHHGHFPDGTPVRRKIRTIAMPGLGTGIGQMPPLDCARQMRIAWEDVTRQMHRDEAHWEKMGSNFAYFYTGDKRDLKYDIP